MNMTKREKTLISVLLVAVIIMVHFYFGYKYKQSRALHLSELEELQTKIETYRMIDANAELTKDEIEWVNQYSPAVESFQNTQTNLLNFLASSSKTLGFTASVKKLTPESDMDYSESYYRTVKVQLSARATEKEIYQWLVQIHQPEKMRVLAYLKLSPPTNDSNLINCQISVEQYFVPE